MKTIEIQNLGVMAKLENGKEVAVRCGVKNFAVDKYALSAGAKSIRDFATKNKSEISSARIIVYLKENRRDVTRQMAVEVEDGDIVEASLLKQASTICEVIDW